MFISHHYHYHLITRYKLILCFVYLQHLVFSLHLNTAFASRIPVSTTQRPETSRTATLWRGYFQPQLWNPPPPSTTITRKMIEVTSSVKQKLSPAEGISTRLGKLQTVTSWPGFTGNRLLNSVEVWIKTEQMRCDRTNTVEREILVLWKFHSLQY